MALLVRHPSSANHPPPFRRSTASSRAILSHLFAPSCASLSPRALGCHGHRRSSSARASTCRTTRRSSSRTSPCEQPHPAPLPLRLTPCFVCPSLLLNAISLHRRRIVGHLMEVLKPFTEEEGGVLKVTQHEYIAGRPNLLIEYNLAALETGAQTVLLFPPPLEKNTASSAHTRACFALLRRRCLLVRRQPPGRCPGQPGDLELRPVQAHQGPGRRPPLRSRVRFPTIFRAILDR